MSQHNEVLEERMTNIQKEVAGLPGLMDKLENKIVNRVDLLVTTSVQTIDNSLKDIKEILKETRSKVETLEKNDHDFELRFKDMVDNRDFSEYKKESREEYKRLLERVDSLEKDKTFLSGGFGMMVKGGAVLIFLLTVLTMSINVYNGIKESHERKKVDEVVK